MGNPANVDNPCGNGCSHGFVHSQSKTDNFKALNAPSATFCLTIQKQFLTNGVISPELCRLARRHVTDPFGVTNNFTTDSTSGQVTACQLEGGTYTVAEELTIRQPVPQPSSCSAFPLQTFLNGVLQPGTGTTRSLGTPRTPSQFSSSTKWDAPGDASRRGSTGLNEPGKGATLPEIITAAAESHPVSKLEEPNHSDVRMVRTMRRRRRCHCSE